MNSRDLEQRLEEGKALKPGPELAERMITGLPRECPPVRPLPSDRALTFLIFAAFAVFCLVVSAAVGFFGFDAMRPADRGVYYGLIAVFGLLFSAGLVTGAIPGAKVRAPAGWLETGAALAVTLAVWWMFPRFGQEQFMKHGIPCLRLGCICAAVFGALGVMVLRRAYVTELRRTALLLACFAGFSGVAVLSLHCPLLDAGHIIVWHLGAMAVSALAGAVIGMRLERGG